MPRIAILTRPDGRNDALARPLRTAGWQVLNLPALDIQPLFVPAEQLPLPQDYDLVIFVSGNAARLYMAQLHDVAGQATWPATTAAATVGPASARALRELPGFGADTTVLCPPPEAATHDSEALWAVLRTRGALPARVLLVRGTQGRDWLADQLTAAGTQVVRHAAYRRQPAPWPAAAVRQLHEWARQDARPAWLLTSGEGLAAVQAQVRQQGLQAWWRGCRYIVTHPALARRLQHDAGGNAPAPMVQICLPADEAILAAFVAA
ncbi:uroporphyrinogen-III synthase [Bordetella sp. BOR01]|uniref:uroporphyrinogen-III synthase n=1 Tax=Bordetella sp. BOR01 TaxID=2854779 RepID=UPI001C47B6BE|nr:uroporphyrinogen-III synthase [Bordetella sp. BOR01]MBV7482471.1 uroporphyrinogen-III synthase [Bordetella sp. BOR01]